MLPTIIYNNKIQKQPKWYLSIDEQIKKMLSSQSMALLLFSHKKGIS